MYKICTLKIQNLEDLSKWKDTVMYWKTQSSEEVNSPWIELYSSWTVTFATPLGFLSKIDKQILKYMDMHEDFREPKKEFEWHSSWMTWMVLFKISVILHHQDSVC